MANEASRGTFESARPGGDTRPHLAPMLKQLGGFVGWLSASLTGLSAILYVLGFIATKAADHLLGIAFSIASHDPTFYIARGGSMVIRAALIAIWPVLALNLAALACRYLLKRRRRSETSTDNNLHRLIDSSIALTIAAAMVAIALSALALIVVPALDVTGLLFRSNSGNACTATPHLENALLTQDRDQLDRWFAWFALSAGLVVGLATVGRERLFRRGVPLAVSSLAVFLILVATPIAYGTLAVELSAPRVWIKPPPGDDGSEMRILSRSDGGVLVWLEKQRLVRWINETQIDTLTVDKSEGLAPCGK